MSYQNCLDDKKVCVVADTSIVININASKFSEKILSALQRRLLVPSLVREELECGKSEGRTAADALKNWEKLGLVEIVDLGSVGIDHFNRLISGATIDTLDDGESATIAHALEFEGIALLDEKKANRICQERFPNLRVGSSMDIFRQEDVKNALGADLANALFNALEIGHMRILPPHLEWTVTCIGKERTSKCISLPARVRNLDS